MAVARRSSTFAKGSHAETLACRIPALDALLDAVGASRDGILSVELARAAGYFPAQDVADHRGIGQSQARKVLMENWLAKKLDRVEVKGGGRTGTKKAYWYRAAGGKP